MGRQRREKPPPPPEKTEQGEDRDPADAAHIVATVGEVARLLGCSVTQAKEYFLKGCPGQPGDRGKQNGRYDIPQIIAWLKENVWKPKLPGFQERFVLETEKLEAEVRLANLRADKMAGTLVEREAVLAELTIICNVIRGRLDQLPIELSNALPAKMRTEFKRDAQNKINLIKQELAEIGATGRPE